MALETVRQLEIVSALAKHGSFHKAAKALGVAQPSLSRSIIALEEHLGVQLFDRDGPVRPTVFGRIIERRGQSILDGFTELNREIALAKGLDIGELRISAGPFPTSISAHRAIGLFAAVHPGITVELLATDWLVTTEHILNGKADLGIAELTEASQHPEIETELIRDSELRLFCRAQHPLAAMEAPTVEDVARFPIVGSRYSDRLLSEVPALRSVSSPDEGGIFRPRIRVDTVAAHIEIVGSSDAVSGIIPELIQPQLEQGLLKLLPLRLPRLRLNYGFIWRRKRTLAPATLVFMDLVRRIEGTIPN